MQVRIYINFNTSISRLTLSLNDPEQNNKNILEIIYNGNILKINLIKLDLLRNGLFNIDLFRIGRAHIQFARTIEVVQPS